VADGRVDVAGLLGSGRIDEAAALAHREGLLAEIAPALLDVPARTGFLDVDLALVRLLEDVLDATEGGLLVPRLQAKLAFELRGDPTSLPRRRELLDAAGAGAGDAAVAEVLLTRIHALGEATPAADRLELAERVIELVRSSRHTEHELEARLARFHALMELGRIVEAEVELGRYERLCGDDAAARAFVTSRRSTLALLHGRYDDAIALADRAHAAALEAGMPDAEGLAGMLHGLVALDRCDAAVLAGAAAALLADAERLPGQHFDATLALIEATRGQPAEARSALARARPGLLEGIGMRWLVAACDAAHTAAAVGATGLAAELHTMLVPHEHEVALFGAGFSGIVVHALAALETHLGMADAAIEHAQSAVRRYDDMAALAWAARARRTLADALELRGPTPEADRLRDAADAVARDIGMAFPAPPLDEISYSHAVSPGDRVWLLQRDERGWTLTAAPETARLPTSRGLDALAMLVDNPRHEVDAIDLDGGDRTVADGGTPVLDDRARLAYRQRLAALDDLLDTADDTGDANAAEKLATERDALLNELRRATGLGGRARRQADDAERARINVTRNLKRAIDRIGRTAPVAAEHLAASIRTGSACRYEPGPMGPDRWQVRRE
jgi:tetratricopeptide (TPR) repeat protein